MAAPRRNKFNIPKIEMNTRIKEDLNVKHSSKFKDHKNNEQPSHNLSVSIQQAGDISKLKNQSISLKLPRMMVQQKHQTSALKQEQFKQNVFSDDKFTGNSKPFITRSMRRSQLSQQEQELNQRPISKQKQKKVAQQKFGVSDSRYDFDAVATPKSSSDNSLLSPHKKEEKLQINDFLNGINDADAAQSSQKSFQNPKDHRSRQHAATGDKLNSNLNHTFGGSTDNRNEILNSDIKWQQQVKPVNPKQLVENAKKSKTTKVSQQADRQQAKQREVSKKQDRQQEESKNQRNQNTKKEPNRSKSQPAKAPKETIKIDNSDNNSSSPDSSSSSQNSDGDSQSSDFNLQELGHESLDLIRSQAIPKIYQRKRLMKLLKNLCVKKNPNLIVSMKFADQFTHCVNTFLVPHVAFKSWEMKNDVSTHVKKWPVAMRQEKFVENCFKMDTNDDIHARAIYNF